MQLLSIALKPARKNINPWQGAHKKWPKIGWGFVIQNQETRNYGHEEMETLETINMVIAEMIASGGLVSGAEQTPTDGMGLKPLRLEAVSLSPGLLLATQC